jgi:hypothetical protein
MMKQLTTNGQIKQQEIINMDTALEYGNMMMRGI